LSAVVRLCSGSVHIAATQTAAAKNIAEACFERDRDADEPLGAGVGVGVGVPGAYVVGRPLAPIGACVVEPATPTAVMPVQAVRPAAWRVDTVVEAAKLFKVDTMLAVLADGVATE
jgi:hypothetical protein